MNGYESSPSTSPKRNTTGPIEERNTSVSFFFFTKFPKNITRNQTEGGLIDRQELHRVNEEVALCWFERVHYAHPTLQREPLTPVLTSYSSR